MAKDPKRQLLGKIARQKASISSSGLTAPSITTASAAMQRLKRRLSR